MITARGTCVIGALALCSLVNAAEKTPQWSPDFKPFNGTYQIYSGSLSELQPPTPTDKQASVMLNGAAARDLFDQIGPDVKRNESCSSDPGFRQRRKGHLDCVHTKEDGYRCYFGINLRTGKSTYGSIC